MTRFGSGRAATRSWAPTRAAARSACFESPSRAGRMEHPPGHERGYDGSQRIDIGYQKACVRAVRRFGSELREGLGLFPAAGRKPGPEPAAELRPKPTHRDCAAVLRYP